MITWLRQIKITTRLALILCFALMGTILLCYITLDSYHKKGLTERKHQIQQLVESTLSTIDFYHQQAQAGEFSETEAQQKALIQLKQLRYDNGSNYFFIIDSAPNMVMHPIKPQLNGKSLSGSTDAAGNRLFVEMVAATRGDGAGFVDYQWSKPGESEPQPKLSYVQQFQPWGWIVGTGVYTDDLYNDLIDMLVVLGLFLGLFGVPLLSIMALMVLSIQGPLTETQQAMARIAQGEADLSRRMEEQGDDEITALAKSFNTFVSNMSEMVTALKQTNGQLGQISGELTNVARQNTQVMEEEAQQTNQLASAITQMSASSNEVQESANLAAGTTSQITEQVVAGRNAVTQTLSASDHLEAELERTTAAVSELHNDSQQIASILDVIGTIAEQTNLLALNAAIEAARAGEQGRGFAVVAGEVRDLANRTQSSTNEIQQMINHIQQRVSDVIERVESSQKQAQDTHTQAQDTEHRFGQIDQAIVEMNQLNNQIAEAVTQQNMMTRHIDESTQALSAHIKSSVKDNRTVSDASDQVATASNELSELVNRFKL